MRLFRHHPASQGLALRHRLSPFGWPAAAVTMALSSIPIGSFWGITMLRNALNCTITPVLDAIYLWRWTQGPMRTQKQCYRGRIVVQGVETTAEIATILRILSLLHLKDWSIQSGWTRKSLSTVQPHPHSTTSTWDKSYLQHLITKILVTILKI